MVKVIGFYNSYDEIGNHESHFEKIGDFTNLSTIFRVTFLSKNTASVETNEGVESLSLGTLIGINAIIRTNSSVNEMKDIFDNCFRICENSEFVLEQTIEGIVPVVYGNVMFIPKVGEYTAYKVKYRTSCYTGSLKQYIQMLSPTSDIYYSFEEPIEIYEYDENGENGEKFTIAKLAPFHKCVIEFKHGLAMRDRYHVKSNERQTLEEFLDIQKNFIFPIFWEKSCSLDLLAQ